VEVSRTIRLEALAPGWTDVVVDPPSEECLTATIVQAGPGKYELAIALDPRRMPNPLKSALTVHDASGDSVDIPVLASLGGPATSESEPPK
jgi:hypothetical protein